VTLHQFPCQLQHMVDGCTALAAITGALTGDRRPTRITLGCVGFRGFWRCRRMSHDTTTISSRADSSIYETFAWQLARFADDDSSLSALRGANSAPLESIPPPSSMTNKTRPFRSLRASLHWESNSQKGLCRHGIIRLQLQYCPGKLSL
jgi:hypothetical protein